MSESLLRLPKDSNLQRWILGAVLLDPKNFAVVAEEMKESHFSIPEYHAVFRAMETLEEQHEKIESKSLFECLKGNDLIEKAGGLAFLESLDHEVWRATAVHVGPETVRQWCHTLKDQTRQHQLLALGLDLETRAQEKRPSREIVKELLAHAEDRISEIREDDSASRSAQHVKDVCLELSPVLEMLGTGKGQRLGRATGLAELDRVSGGLIASEYWIIGACTSVGKTALALEIALRQAKAGSPVAIFSLEMSRESLLLRLICMEAKVSYKLLTDGDLVPKQWWRISAAIATISELPIWIHDRPAPNAHDLRWRIKSLSSRINAKLCIVDYIQLIRGRKTENRYEAVTQSSMELKAAAKEIGLLTGATLIAISQLTDFN